MQQWFKNHSLAVSAVGVLCLVFGFWLSVIYPEQRTASVYDSATEALRQEASQAEALQKEAGQAALWYKPEYFIPINLLFDKSRARLVFAGENLKKAKEGNVDEKYAFSTEALNVLQSEDQSVSALLTAIRLELNGYAAIRTDTIARFHSTNSKAADMAKMYAVVQNRYAEEGVKYISKYIQPLKGELVEANECLLLAHADLQKIPAFLPPEQDVSRSGDPKSAMSLLRRVDSFLEQGNALINNVQRNLSFQKEAADNIAQAIADASAWEQKAEGHLSVTSANYKLSAERSLKLAYADYRDAALLLKIAQETLRTKVEGKYDTASAYADALRSVEQAKATIAEADTQVRLWQEAAEGVRKLLAAIDNAVPLVSSARDDVVVLKQNHNVRVWKEVAGNADEAAAQATQAEKALSKAEAYADVATERFSDAINAIRSGVESVGRIQQLFDELRARRVTLEDARSSWSSAERRAQSEIDAERSNVSRYGSYSNSARSDFARAEDLLRQARNAAKDRDYEKAVALATSAKQSADGTGSKARRAYDDEQEEKAREKRRAEERERESQSRSHSSPSISGGGGGSYSGGSRSHDGGGYGGGRSHSSDGGGW